MRCYLVIQKKQSHSSLGIIQVWKNRISDSLNWVRHIVYRKLVFIQVNSFNVL